MRQPIKSSFRKLGDSDLSGMRQKGYVLGTDRAKEYNYHFSIYSLSLINPIYQHLRALIQHLSFDFIDRASLI